MNGAVDYLGRALVRIGVRNPSGKQVVAIDAWIDTGFTGELVLPEKLLSALGLESAHSVNAELGDGSQAIFEAYACEVVWFGGPKEIMALGCASGFPLLGVGLLKGHKLAIDYDGGPVSVT